MPQAIAHPVWKMIWTTTLKTGPWSNKPCMGPTSLCIKFLEPKRGVGPGLRKMGPGWDPVGPGWDPVGPGWDAVDPVRPANTKMGLDGKTWGRMHVARIQCSTQCHVL